MAIVLPLALALVFGVFDVGHIIDDTNVAGDAARAGLQYVVANSTAIGGTVASPTSNVGTQIRNQTGMFACLPITNPSWGPGCSGPGNDDCQGNDHCGDPSGCASDSTWWSSAGETVACYSVGVCSLGPPTSSNCSPVTWGVCATGTCSDSTTTPPPPLRGSGQTLVVTVVFKFVPLTPFVAKLYSGGTFFAGKTVYGQETY